MMDFDKLGISGPHCYMSPEERKKLYQEIKEIHDKHLKQYNITLPKEDSNKALWLIYLYKYRRKLVHKDTISNFVKSIDSNAAHDQQIRHLGREGWYVLNKGDLIPGTDDQKMSVGYHLLYDINFPKPSYLHEQLKRTGRIGAKSFEELKVVYNNKCATCGAEDKKPHPRFKNKVVQLQQGHMDPTLSLKLENTIPQCQVCNQTYKDFFIFDENGYIKALNNPQFVVRSKENVKKEIFEFLRDLLDEGK